MKYFLDCGTHFFEGYNEFHKKYNFTDDWTVYCYEANPRTYNLAKQKIPTTFKKNDKFYNLAVSDHDGEIFINCDMEDNIGTGVGSNILKTPPVQDGRYFIWEKETVKCFDLSKFISSITDKDILIIKLDIEGAEFDVLNKIINDKTYLFIDEMYVEFHERFFHQNVEYYKNLKNNFVKFFSDNNVKFNLWI
jgi:FkbM family methyltransferase